MIYSEVSRCQSTVFFNNWHGKGGMLEWQKNQEVYGEVLIAEPRKRAA